MESDETNNSAGPFTISIPPYPEVNVIEYLLYRDNGEVPVAVTNETTVLDTGLIDGQEYCYTVKASVQTGSDIDPSQLTSPGDPVCVATEGIFANLCSPSEFDGESRIEIIDGDTLNSITMSWAPVGSIGSGIDTSHVPMYDGATGSLTNQEFNDTSTTILAKNMSSGWLSFDLSNLVPGLMPIYTELNVQVINTNKPIWSVTPMHTDPLADTLEAVHADITEEAGTPEAHGNFIETDEFSPGNYSYILTSNTKSYP